MRSGSFSSCLFNLALGLAVRLAMEAAALVANPMLRESLDAGDQWTSRMLPFLLKVVARAVPKTNESGGFVAVHNLVQVVRAFDQVEEEVRSFEWTCIEPSAPLVVPLPLGPRVLASVLASVLDVRKREDSKRCV